jgi:hypothetical protein
MIDGDAALGHHLLQVPQAEIVGEIPSHAEQDHRWIKMPALEHATLFPEAREAIAETLKQNVCDTSR